MVTDKDLGMQLVDWIEELLFDQTAMEAMLEYKGLTDWKLALADLKQLPKYQNFHISSLQKLRDVILEAPDWSAAVRQLLATLEEIDPED
jgi:hypothetical protein